MKYFAICIISEIVWFLSLWFAAQQSVDKTAGGAYAAAWMLGIIPVALLAIIVTLIVETIFGVDR